MEAILGIRRRGGRLSVDPCMPTQWESFSATWRHGRTVYEIVVRNPERKGRGIAEARLDGESVDPGEVPLHDDGRRHVLEATLGEAAAEDRRPRAARIAG
jgi:cyclic beta-1,2-glucan synthetase